MTTLLEILELTDLYKLGARMRPAPVFASVCMWVPTYFACFYLPFHFGKSFCWNMHIPFACKCNSSNGIVHIKYILSLLAKAVKTVKVTLQFVSQVNSATKYQHPIHIGKSIPKPIVPNRANHINVASIHTCHCCICYARLQNTVHIQYILLMLALFIHFCVLGAFPSRNIWTSFVY